MATKLRTSLSLKSKYYISKERRLELKHFCLQYHEWEDEIFKLNYYPTISGERIKDRYGYDDPTAAAVMMREEYERRLDMIRMAADTLDDPISPDIFKAVTNDLTWPYFESHGIACGRDYFYDRYKRFFYILDQIRM